MIIVDGKKHYAKEVNRMVQIDNGGWDYYDGQNHQWYYLYYNKDSGLCKLKAQNSSPPFGENWEKYYNSPTELIDDKGAGSIGRLLGDIDESNDDVMHFVNAAFAE